MAAKATFTVSRRYISSLSFPTRQQRQSLNHTPSPHSILFLETLSLFINLIQVKFQGKQYSPFETHPITMGVGVVALILYFLSLDAFHWRPFRSQNRVNNVVRQCSAVFGYMSLACMASTLLPDMATPFFYLLCFFSLAAAVLCPVLTVRRRRATGRRVVQRFSQKFWKIVRFRSSKLDESLPI